MPSYSFSTKATTSSRSIALTVSVATLITNGSRRFRKRLVWDFWFPLRTSIKRVASSEPLFVVVSYADLELNWLSFLMASGNIGSAVVGFGGEPDCSLA